MKKLLWLDDLRDPTDELWSDLIPKGSKVIKWVKSYDQFIDWITYNGLPDVISFDHDLGDILGPNEKTGMSCAKWLVDYCIDYNKPLPEYHVHSSNPAGKMNIESLLSSFTKHQNSIKT